GAGQAEADEAAGPAEARAEARGVVAGAERAVLAERVALVEAVAEQVALAGEAVLAERVAALGVERVAVRADQSAIIPSIIPIISRAPLFRSFLLQWPPISRFLRPLRAAL